MNKHVDLTKATALKAPLDPAVIGFCEEIGSFQAKIDATDKRREAEGKARSELVMEQFLAGCQAFSMIGYNAERSYAIRAFKADLRDRKVPDKAVKEIAELGRHIINKAKKWKEPLTKDGQKIDAVSAFQTWPRNSLRDMLKGQGFATLTDIRRDKYPALDWPDSVIKKANDFVGKNNDFILDLYAKLGALIASKPELAGGEPEST